MNEPLFDDDHCLQLKRALQAFQQKRLLTTYSDVIKNPEYTRIARFFFEKIYAPEDFSSRNAGIRKLHHILKGRVHKGIVSAMKMVFELHDLADALDDLMVERMIEQGMGPDFETAHYECIYRELDNYDERMHQIEMTVETAAAFHRLSKMWIVGLSLKAVRRTARLMQMGDLIDFVHEGYQGFRSIDTIDELVAIIKDRETMWHDRIWNGNPACRQNAHGLNS